MKRVYNTTDPAIQVTKPFLPPLPELLPDLQELWDSQWLTNHGPFYDGFLVALQPWLGSTHINLVANGTLGLLATLRSMNLVGEVITTPYSFAATAHSIAWLGLEPVFADIDPSTMNLDPASVEQLINERTTLIMPVHTYGIPCDTEAFDDLSASYDIPVVYDAAHAFGVRKGGTSLLAEGDASVVSFHATKVFTTFEGGAVVSSSAEQAREIRDVSNFGIVSELEVTSVGINAKMNEFSALLGLHQLRHFESVRSKRSEIDQTYRETLSDLDWVRMPPEPEPDVDHNYSYFPIRVRDEFGMRRDEVYDVMMSLGIYPRRYFHPLLSDLPMYRGALRADSLENAEAVGKEILCLPIYPGMTEDDQGRVIDALRKAEL